MMQDDPLRLPGRRRSEQDHGRVAETRDGHWSEVAFERERAVLGIVEVDGEPGLGGGLRPVYQPALAQHAHDRALGEHVLDLWRYQTVIDRHGRVAQAREREITLD